ncbi:hypothetical protein KOXY103107_06430 [Komagataeibacter xylinus]
MRADAGAVNIAYAIGHVRPPQGEFLHQAIKGYGNADFTRAAAGADARAHESQLPFCPRSNWAVSNRGRPTMPV